jgi:hypothetical protein
VSHFIRADGAPRVGFEFLSTQNRYAHFTAPWAKDLECVVGRTPEDDFIGPPSALNPQVTMWRFLTLFGLQWDRFLKELPDSPALYSRLDLNGAIDGFFKTPDDISPELTETVLRHGAQLVQWNMVITTDWGLGIERGATHLPEFVPVITEGDDFAQAVRKMQGAWDSLASTVLVRNNVHLFNPDGSLTDDGRSVVGGLWRPVVNAYPAITTAWSAEKNQPIMTFPISPAKWSIGGIAALGLLAERLGKLPMNDLINPTGVCALTNNAKIAPWAAENVPEFAAVKTAQEESL